MMPRIGSPTLGPYEKWTKEFLELSSRAYGLLAQHWPSSSDVPTAELVRDFAVHSEATSLAMRASLTHNYSIAAASLLRVRLEQCIVLSFLVHSDWNDGWGPYLAHIDVQQYEFARKLAKVRSDPSDLTALRTTSERAQKEFSLLQSRWNRPPLSDLARRRDEAAGSRRCLPWTLEKEYFETYPICSFAVHTSASVLYRATELHRPTLDAEQQYPYIIPDHARWMACALARYDMIQCFDSLAAQSAVPEQEFARLLGAYSDAAEAG